MSLILYLFTQAKPKKPVIVEVSDTDSSEEESIGRRGSQFSDLRCLSRIRILFHP
jgi:hypothetical protein